MPPLLPYAPPMTEEAPPPGAILVTAAAETVETCCYLFGCEVPLDLLRL